MTVSIILGILALFVTNKFRSQSYYLGLKFKSGQPCNQKAEKLSSKLNHPLFRIDPNIKLIRSQKRCLTLGNLYTSDINILKCLQVPLMRFNVQDKDTISASFPQLRKVMKLYT